MKRLMLINVGLLVLLSVCCAAAAAITPPLPKYQGWKKSVRKVVADKKSLFYGIHYIYADPKAIKGYQAGNKFPEGSRIVVEHFNIKGDSTVDGPKNMVVLMKKDKSQKTTGGWLYVGYTADGKPSRLDPVKNCFECHQKEVAGRDYVFSGIADFK